MKWDISRDDNIMDNIIDGADDFMLEDIQRNDVVDTKVIKKMTLEKSGIVKSSKKRVKKRTVFTLIAAAVAIIALGTVAVGASGTFDSVFGEYFAGEPTNGLYPGGNVSVNINGELKADFMGITGDDRVALAAISITKEDGSDFVSGKMDSFVSFSGDNDLDENGMISMTSAEENVTLNKTLSVPDSMLDAYGYVGNLSTNNTVELLFGIRSEPDVSPKGRGLYFSIAPKMYIYQIDKRLFDFEFEEMSDVCADMKKYRSELKDGQVLKIYYDTKVDKWFLITAYKTAYDFDLSVSVKLNYRSDNKYFYTSADNIVTCKSATCRICDISAGSLMVSMNGECVSDISDFDVSFSDDSEKISDSIANSKVFLTMKDGTEVACRCDTYSSGDQDGKYDWEWIFTYVDPNSDRLMRIDPENIVSITVDDMTFSVK